MVAEGVGGVSTKSQNEKMYIKGRQSRECPDSYLEDVS